MSGTEYDIIIAGGSSKSPSYTLLDTDIVLVLSQVELLLVLLQDVSPMPISN